MIGNPAAGHPIDEIPLGVTRQGRFCKMRIAADVVARGGKHIGKVAAPAAADTNFLAHRFCVINHQTAAWRLGGAHHAGRASSNNEGIIIHRR